MTDQPANSQFHASSFLQGHNADYVEQIYARYATDPNAVDESWAAYFRALGDAPEDARAEADRNRLWQGADRGTLRLVEAAFGADQQGGGRFRPREGYRCGLAAGLIREE